MMLALVLCLACILPFSVVFSWIPHPQHRHHDILHHHRYQFHSSNPRRSLVKQSLSSIAADSSSLPTTTTTSSEDDDDDNEEYEIVEYDLLTEKEFVGSEWLVGTNWDGQSNRIDETWVRLAVDDKGKNIAIWGDQSQGSWNLDVASQFLSISKENLLGKQIWACTTDDFYFLQGTVRGWTYWQPASVLAQWQAKRLGVDVEEAGTPPWFEPSSQEPQLEQGENESSNA